MSKQIQEAANTYVKEVKPDNPMTCRIDFKNGAHFVLTHSAIKQVIQALKDCAPSWLPEGVRADRRNALKALEKLLEE